MYKFRNANSIQRAIHNYYMIVNNLAELRMNPAFKMQVAQKHVDNLYLKLENPSKMKLYIENNLQNYQYKLGHYSAGTAETVLYAIPDELAEL